MRKCLTLVVIMVFAFGCASVQKRFSKKYGCPCEQVKVSYEEFTFEGVHQYSAKGCGEEANYVCSGYMPGIPTPCTGPIHTWGHYEICREMEE